MGAEVLRTQGPGTARLRGQQQPLNPSKAFVIVLLWLWGLAGAGGEGLKGLEGPEFLSSGLNTVEEFNNIRMALEQYADGSKLRSIPPHALRTFSRRLGRLLPTKPTYWAGEEHEGGPMVTNSRTKREARHAIILPPVQCQDSRSVGYAPSGMSQTFQDSLCEGRLPEAKQVWERVMLRNGYQEETRVPHNQLMVSFVNWFHDDSFRTRHGTDGAKMWRDKDPLTLSQVYGDSPEREFALRTLERGKLKSRLVGGEEWPPLWSSVKEQHPEFEMWVPHRNPLGAQNSSFVNSQHFMAFGDPRFNMHTGHVVWGTLFLRLHNHLCDLVLSERPALTDQEVFAIVRRLTSHLMIKIRLENFVSDAISHFRDSARIHYDPDLLRNLTEFRVEYIAPWLEFNLLYRWHWLIPENLRVRSQSTDVGTSALTDIPLRHTLWNPHRVVAQGLKKATWSLTETGTGRAGSRNVPSFLSHATLDAINTGRKQKIRGYNDYLRFFNMPVMASFQDFGLDSEATAALEALYTHPDNVDYFVGIQIEKGEKIKGNAFGDGNLVLVALLALQDAISHDVISVPEMWSETLLTKAGKRFIQDFSLEDWLSEILGQRLECPFFTVQNCIPVSQQKWPGDRTCRLKNIGDFSGMDYLGDWIFTHDPHHMWTFCVSLLSAPLLVCLVYFAVGKGVQSWQRSLPASTVEHSKFDLANLALLSNAVVYTALFIPVTKTNAQLLFSSSFDQEIEAHGGEFYFYVALTFSMHIAELVIRCFLRPSMTLVLHHALTGMIVCWIVWQRSIFGMRLGVILVAFVFLEWPLFVAMALDRINVSPRFLPHSAFKKLLFGPLISLYLVTRLLSAAVLVGFMMATQEMMQAQGQAAHYWFMCFCSATVSVMQFIVLSPVKRAWLRHSEAGWDFESEGSEHTGSIPQHLSAVAVYEASQPLSSPPLKSISFDDTAVHSQSSTTHPSLDHALAEPVILSTPPAQALSPRLPHALRNHSSLRVSAISPSSVSPSATQSSRRRVSLFSFVARGDTLPPAVPLVMSGQSSALPELLSFHHTSTPSAPDIHNSLKPETKP